jgi:hypothetical protein
MSEFKRCLGASANAALLASAIPTPIVNADTIRIGRAGIAKENSHRMISIPRSLLAQSLLSLRLQVSRRSFRLQTILGNDLLAASTPEL